MQILRFKAPIEKGMWRLRCVLKVTGKGNNRLECSRRWVCVLTPLKGTREADQERKQPKVWGRDKGWSCTLGRWQKN